jgi:predicted Zn-dependent peptidase
VAFNHYVLDNGLSLYVQPSTKFKTVMLKVFWQQNLDEHAAKNALLASILKRGTSANPTSTGLNRLMDELYGAEFDTGVTKKGEQQIQEFSLELVKDSLVGEPVLERGLELLREILLEPFVENQGFSENYLEQEKEQLTQIIEGIVNDKVQYSIERCLQELGKGERFGLPRYGKVTDFVEITPQNLYSHYLERRQSVPIVMFVVGDVDPEKVYQSVNKIFSFSHSGNYQLLPVEVKSNPTKVKEIVERQEINQGKLTLGYRTNACYKDDSYPALVVYNGVLGAFAHSKLFQNVREKSSLAYYATSKLEKTKGILLIASGIEFSNCTQARKIIEEQVCQMAEGQITTLELDNTKKALIHQLRSSTDNFHLTIDLALDGLVNGRHREIDELIQQIQAVSIEDLVKVAEGIKLDTVYYLTNMEGEGANE